MMTDELLCAVSYRIIKLQHDKEIDRRILLYTENAYMCVCVCAGTKFFAFFQLFSFIIILLKTT